MGALLDALMELLLATLQVLALLWLICGVDW